MTIEAMNARLKELGLKKRYRPVWESETETILLTMRRPVKMLEGGLFGSEIALPPKYGKEGIFIVWTPQKKKAKAFAAIYKLKVRLYSDCESELQVPARLADLILPIFWAKVRREMSPEAREAAKARMQVARNALGLPKNPNKTGVKPC